MKTMKIIVIGITMISSAGAADYLKKDLKGWPIYYQDINDTSKNKVIQQALIQLEKGRWLFAGVFRVLDVEKQSNGRVLYSTELLEDQENLIGRVIVDKALAAFELDE